MLVHGTCELDQLQANLHDDRVLALAQRVEAVVDPALEFPGIFPASIRLRGRDGRVLVERSIIGPRGATLSAEELGAELEQKFISNAAPRFGRGRAAELYARLTDIATHRATPASTWLQ
jgi:2-methylcitrate dehydratase PrpD